ncbi:MAG: carbohydrate kinase family protein [Ignisphaera sp.]|nr:carbohydrate kinase family protein [Ignisphaera sp.]MCX8167710.1 carbohydrate kinase family protein [Ignisphaera sp.]MDW8085274.1 carbohydrate kinase family protein [Ignisphaera sp.]
MVVSIVLTGVAVCDIIIAGLERVAEPGDIVYVTGLSSIEIGGHPCNISIDLVKMGYRSGDIITVSSVGNDLCGKFILNTLRSYGIVTEFQIHRDAQTNKNIILVVKNEDRRFHVDVDATTRLSIDHVISVIERYRPRLFYIAPGLLGSVDERLRDVLTVSRRLNAINMIDIGAAKPFGKKGWDFLIDSLNSVDIFHANLYEIRRVFGIDSISRAAKSLLNQGVRIVLITDGENGAYLAKDGYLVYQPAFKVEVIDPTGAGDAFQAGFIYKLIDALNGDLNMLDTLELGELKHVLLWAQASGASCVMGVGATTSVSRKNINQLISSQGDSILRATKICTIE